MNPIAIEHEIAQILSRHGLSDVLYATFKLKKSIAYLNNFEIASIIKLAIAFCNQTEQISHKGIPIRYIRRLARAYALSDPIGFDEATGQSFLTENPIFFVLRLLANQWPFYEQKFTGFARAFILFDIIPSTEIKPPNK